MASPAEYRKLIDRAGRRKGLSKKQIKAMYVINGIESKSGTADESAYYQHNTILKTWGAGNTNKDGSLSNSTLNKIAKKKGWYDADGNIVGESIKTDRGRTIPKKLYEYTADLATAGKKHPTTGKALTADEIKLKQENLFNDMYGTRNGNSEPGDGWKYRGRGGVQLTGKSNYRKLTERLNANGVDIDLVKNPELASDIRYSADILIAFADKEGMFTEGSDKFITDEDYDLIATGDANAIDKLHNITNVNADNEHITKLAKKVYETDADKYIVSEATPEEDAAAEAIFQEANRPPTEEAPVAKPWYERAYEEAKVGVTKIADKITAENKALAETNAGKPGYDENGNELPGYDAAVLRGSFAIGGKDMNEAIKGQSQEAVPETVSETAEVDAMSEEGTTEEGATEEAELTAEEKQAESYQNIQDEFPDGEYHNGGDVYVIPDGRIYSYDGKMGTYDRETKKANWTHNSYTAGKDWRGTPGYEERQAKKDKIAAQDAVIAAQDAERKAQEQADIDKYGEKGTLITEGPHRGGTRFSDNHYRDIYGDDVYEGTYHLPTEGTADSNGAVNIQDLPDEDLSTTTGVVEQGETLQDIERRIQDNKDLLNNLGNRPQFVHDYAPDQQKNTNLIDNITDAGRIAMGGIAANTEIPVYERGSMFQTSMDELTDRRNIGLTDTEKDFARNMAERGYGYDIKNIEKFAGGSAGVALGNLGRATGQLYDQYGEIAVRDEGVRRQNRADFNRGALSDEQVNRQIFEDDLNQKMMTKQAGAALVQDATKNIRERAQYEKAYGKGSQMYEYMKTLDRDKKESIFNQNEADARRVEDMEKTTQRAIEDDTIKLENFGGITPDTVLGGEPTATEGLKNVEELQQMKKDGVINNEVYQERLRKLDADVEMPDDFIPVSAATQATPEVETVRNSGVDSRSKPVVEEVDSWPEDATQDEIDKLKLAEAEQFNASEFTKNEVPKIDARRNEDVEFNDNWTPKDQANIDASFQEEIITPEAEKFDANAFSDETTPEDNIKDYEAELAENPETLKKYKEDPIAFLEDDIKGWESEPDSEKKTKSLKNLRRNLKFLKAAKEENNN